MLRYVNLSKTQTERYQCHVPGWISLLDRMVPRFAPPFGANLGNSSRRYVLFGEGTCN
jgi:hypothetical protein